MQLLHDGPADATLEVILAHGAGAPMDSPFLEAFARGLGAAGWRVTRFEFPYMRKRRETGKKRAPDKGAALEQCWREVCAGRPVERLVIGGKSMGGRVASMVADALQVRGLVCLGYPFHPIGKPERTRTAHLAQLRTETLIVQGSRDPMGRRDTVLGYQLADTIELCWIEDGDHSFKPRKASGRTQQQCWEQGVAAVDQFLRRL